MQRKRVTSGIKYRRQRAIVELEERWPLGFAGIVLRHERPVDAEDPLDRQRLLEVQLPFYGHGTAIHPRAVMHEVPLLCSPNLQAIGATYAGERASRARETNLG